MFIKEEMRREMEKAAYDFIFDFVYLKHYRKTHQDYQADIFQQTTNEQMNRLHKDIQKVKPMSEVEEQNFFKPIFKSCDLFLSWLESCKQDIEFDTLYAGWKHTAVLIVRQLVDCE